MVFLSGADFCIESMLTFGDDATPWNTVHPEAQCSNVTTNDDDYKEDDEYFKLWLHSGDDQVCFGRDFALLKILEDTSDGMCWL